ncbi:MAG: hypothetical protein VR65_19835 [Desulfobulbaceae bacterium BRH_c16a]|nr:MAG: hypothetical protein VR65_19835 [Desulfobulbaceae bacterium BRH_c16a]
MNITPTPIFTGRSLQMYQKHVRPLPVGMCHAPMMNKFACINNADFVKVKTFSFSVSTKLLSIFSGWAEEYTVQPAGFIRKAFDTFKFERLLSQQPPIRPFIKVGIITFEFLTPVSRLNNVTWLKETGVQIVVQIVHFFSPCVKLMVGWSRPDRVAQGEIFLKVIN